MIDHDDTTVPGVSQSADPLPDTWLFGYGSLLYKVDFPWLERRAARIHGWQRRFWQGSHDHRGTPESPGRVLTLIEAPDQACDGIAYRIRARTLRQLDIREKNGYQRFELPLWFDDGQRASGLTYLARKDNEAWLGPASPAAIAEQILGARGPSGPNRDYLRQLAATLRRMRIEDAHVFAIERELDRLMPA